VRRVLAKPLRQRISREKLNRASHSKARFVRRSCRPQQTVCGPATGSGPRRQALDGTTSCISIQLSSAVLRSSVSPDKFPGAGEGFPCPCAPTILLGDRRDVLVLPISLSDMCPLRCRNSVPGSEREGFTQIVGYPEVILGRHFLIGMSDFSWEIPASRVKHRIANRPSPEKPSYRNAWSEASARQKATFQ
jgi:hypothetical protein